MTLTGRQFADNPVAALKQIIITIYPGGRISIMGSGIIRHPATTLNDESVPTFTLPNTAAMQAAITEAQATAVPIIEAAFNAGQSVPLN